MASSRSSSDNSFFITCKQRLKDQYIQGWSGKILESSNTMLYEYMYPLFHHSDYLDILNLPLYRYAMRKFLAGNHRLHRLPNVMAI